MKKRFSNKLAVVLALLLVLCLSFPALGAAPHEDPETVEQVFSGISLLNYYSSSLDLVLQKDPMGTETKLGKMPFTNVPQSLTEATNRFAASGIDIANQVVDIDRNHDTLREMMKQSRFEEAVELADDISTQLSLAYDDLDEIESATEVTGREIGAISAPLKSDLRKAYEEVLDRIEKIREMLDLDKGILEDVLLGLRAIEKQSIARPTELTLSAEPTTLFVGDEVHFEGALTSAGEPLSRREVDILLNGTRYASSITDAHGHYQGALKIPLWYINQMNLQALYYPRHEDVGLYLSSLSPVVELEVLFYEAALKLTVEDKAYPGLETAVEGEFDYGQFPLPTEREIEVYFDNAVITESLVGESFSEKVPIPSQTELGAHTITVSAQGMGRYAPVTSSAPIDVTRAALFLDVNVPGIALVPGSIALKGKIDSEVGPAEGAAIKMKLGKSQVELVSSEKGTFDTEIKMGMGFNLIGSEEVKVQIIPTEPWHAPLATARSLVMINVVNSGVILVVLACLGVLARGWRRRAPTPEKKPTPAAEISPGPSYGEPAPVPAVEADRSPRGRMLHLYRLILSLIQGFTNVLPKPHQTLREFFTEVRSFLGPVAGYFEELTRMVEKLLYSRYEPSEGDAMKSEELSHNIEEGIQGENR